MIYLESSIQNDKLEMDYNLSFGLQIYDESFSDISSFFTKLKNILFGYINQKKKIHDYYIERSNMKKKLKAINKLCKNKKIANTKTVQKIAQGLQSKGGLFGKIGNHIINTANGVASKLWSEDSKFLKNNIKAILANKNVKKAISNYLIGNIPKYLAQEIIGKLIDKVKPSKAIWDMIKKSTTNWLKNTLGIVDQAKICVPVPVI